MPKAKRRLKVLVGTLGSATVLAAVSAAPASAVEVPNACANSINSNLTEIGVDLTGASPPTGNPGESLTLSNIQQTMALPPTVFVAGYNLSLLQQGVNNIPVSVLTMIEGTNTVEGVQATNTVGGTPPDGSLTVSTTISDPDGTPGTGDETATPAELNVSYADQNWTAGPAGTIRFREDTVTPLGPDQGGVLIRVLVAGFLNVYFRCSPGTVAGSDPGIPTFIDPAPAFATTENSALDVTPPETTIVSGPAGPTANRRPTFGFTSDEPGSSFECSIDRGAPSFAPCSGAATHTPASPLADGPWTFRVRAIDPDDNVDATPATRSFRVDGTRPVVRIKRIRLNHRRRRARIRFVGFDNLTPRTQLRFQCRLDVGRLRPCRSPKVYRKLLRRRHSVRVRAIDRVGNVSRFAVRKFRIRRKR